MGKIVSLPLIGAECSRTGNFCLVVARHSLFILRSLYGVQLSLAGGRRALSMPQCSTITQYGSTVDCYGLSPLKTMYKRILHFHFQFQNFDNVRVEST